MLNSVRNTIPRGSVCITKGWLYKKEQNKADSDEELQNDLDALGPGAQRRVQLRLPLLRVSKRLSNRAHLYSAKIGVLSTLFGLFRFRSLFCPGAMAGLNATRAGSAIIRSSHAFFYLLQFWPHSGVSWGFSGAIAFDGCVRRVGSGASGQIGTFSGPFPGQDLFRDRRTNPHRKLPRRAKRLSFGRARSVTRKRVLHCCQHHGTCYLVFVLRVFVAVFHHNAGTCLRWPGREYTQGTRRDSCQWPSSLRQ